MVDGMVLKADIVPRRRRIVENTHVITLFSRNMY